MSRPPLVARCDRLTRAVMCRVRGWPPVALALVGQPAFEAAVTLQCGVAHALLNPGDRAEMLGRADSALSRLRALVALTDVDPPLLDAAARSALGEQIDAVGKMLGGWRKQLARHRAGRGPPGSPGR